MLLKSRPWQHDGPQRRSAGSETQFIGQADPLLLAGWAFWYFLEDQDLARDFEVSDPSNDELTELLRHGQGLRPQYDRRGDILTQSGVGDSKGHRLCHRWMLQQNVVHFLRGYLLPTAIDDLAYAPSKKQVPVIIKQTNIPRLEPIARKCSRGPGLVAVITCHDA